jgi:hypothetical protein
MKYTCNKKGRRPIASGLIILRYFCAESADGFRINT